MVPKVTEGKDRCPVQEGAPFCEGRDAHGRWRPYNPPYEFVRIRGTMRSVGSGLTGRGRLSTLTQVCQMAGNIRAICSVHDDTSLAEGRDDYERWRLKTPSTNSQYYGTALLCYYVVVQ